MTKETGLTPRLLEVAQMLASGMTYSQISEAVSIPRSTIGRWAKMEAVQAQVAALKNEAIEAHRQISREAATEVAQDLQGKLAQSVKRQEGMIAQGYSLAAECLDLTQKMLTKASEIFRSNRVIEPHEKILISSLPIYMRAASDMVRSVSDAEDKCFGIEEIAKRLDEWQQFNNSQN
jgi:IS30 family transposase